ncbi:MAG: hypothetical protein RJA70_398 [Pseudomonadota bacterium]
MGANRMAWGVAVVALALAGCHARPTIEKKQAAAGEGRHLVDASVVTAPGSVEPWFGEVKLASTEPGRLSEVLAVEGQLVKQGDLLVRLERSQQQHAVLIAESELRQAAALLAGVSSTKEEVQAAAAEVEAAAARANQRRRESQRAASLGASGVLAVEAVEQLAAASVVEDAALAAGEARLLAIKRGARSSERQQLRARWESAQARLADAQAALMRREVRATIDGTVLWSRYHAGEYYSPGQGPLLVLGDMKRPQVCLEVDDTDGELVLVGAKVVLRTDGGELLGRGSVVRIASSLGSRSLSTERPTERTDARVREVFVEVETPTTLSSGQRVWGQIDRAARHAAR